ncbi:16S rRNA (uracil(1498)-N(3))-methyltransferase [Hyphococcus sp.]|uniref:16S rRNA (uracil(1498)-N(3))-methyltransferase n=1 Tax=Hyphococcus sp. TaxID=2038636 RepID=UPI0020834FC3|nr:MAG: ribosomal RNA small subunit methyltransferase E [Marinicaulis sp.]
MTPRLYINGPLHAGLPAPLSADQAHYLKNVLRRAEGDALLLFNGKDGEFAASIAELKKKAGAAQVTHQTRAQAAEPDLTLYFAPVKRGPLEMIVQKAVEVGAARLQPVITERTVAAKLNVDRLLAIAIEAAEQCGRLSVPSVGEPTKLASLIENFPQGARLLFCDEAGDDETEEWGGKDGRAAPALDALKAVDSKADGQDMAWGVITGPEGGFSPDERKRLRSQSFVTAATLGPRILRADTAAIAALVLWQAALGDWRQP